MNANYFGWDAHLPHVTFACNSYSVIADTDSAANGMYTNRFLQQRIPLIVAKGIFGRGYYAKNRNYPAVKFEQLSL